MKTKVLIHTCMIVVCVGSLRGRLAYVYDSYTYNSSTAMNHTSKLLVRLTHRLPMYTTIIQYAYETKANIFTSHAHAHANHTQRIVRACQSYARDSRKRLTHTISLCM